MLSGTPEALNEKLRDLEHRPAVEVLKPGDTEDVRL